MDIIIKTKKKRAVKKLLGIKDTEFKEVIEKVIDDHLNNIISTNYQTKKGIDEMVDDVNK